MTDAEWALILPHLPGKNALGRPCVVPLRGVIDALLYILRTACPWRLLPRDFPKRSTVQRYFYAWQAEGLWEKVNFLLVQQARERDGREASPSAEVIDSQSTKTTESGGPRGYDAGKKINGCKRRIITDTSGHLVGAPSRHPGSRRRTRPAGFDPLPLPVAAPCHPPSRGQAFADGAYAGDKLETALDGRGQWTLEIVKRSDQAQGFQVLPRRWVVERTLAWFGRDCRLTRDFERTITSSEAWLYLASIQLLARRLARSRAQVIDA